VDDIGQSSRQAIVLTDLVLAEAVAAAILMYIGKSPKQIVGDLSMS